jgi:tetratricopeptide (TPR) repeat protein
LDDSLRTLLIARDLGELAALPPDTAALQFCRGFALARQGRDMEARELFKRALDGDPSLRHAVDIERLSLDLRAREDAPPIASRALTIIEEKPADKWLLGRAHLIAGIALHRMDQHVPALAELGKARGLADEIDDVAGRADALEAMAVAHSWRSEHELAVNALTLAITDRALSADRAALANTVASLGRANLELERFGQALSLFERALKLLGDQGDPHEIARVRNNVGQAHLGNRDFTKAETCFEAERIPCATAGWRYLSFLNERDLAATLVRADHAIAAGQAIERAKRFLPKERDSFEANSLGFVEAELEAVNRAPAAVELLANAVAAAARRKLPPHEIRLRLLLAETLAARGGTDEAEAVLIEAHRVAASTGVAAHVVRVGETMSRLNIARGLVVESGKSLVASFQEGRRGFLRINRQGEPGGYGEVHKVYDPERGEDMALKVIKLSDQVDSAVRMERLDSWRRELLAVSKIRHPGVNRVREIGDTPEGDLYIVQDFVAGPTLAKTMRHTDWPLERILRILAKLAHALGHLHDNDVIHCDLKPNNIILAEGFNPVIIDFGLAHARIPGFPSSSSGGTAAYIAPERGRGGEPTKAADLYAFGVITAEWLLGSVDGLPFAADDGKLEAVIQRRWDLKLPKLSEKVRLLMSWDPKDRPGSAWKIARSLTEFSEMLAKQPKSPFRSDFRPLAGRRRLRP